MVAYSFNPQFAKPVLQGTKVGTIRRLRKAPSRLARSGEPIQIYTGMRTKYCRRIGLATCISVRVIWLSVKGDSVFYPSDTDRIYRSDDLEAFAVADGFPSWRDLTEFWEKTHPGVSEFEGVHIVWGDTFVPTAN